MSGQRLPKEVRRQQILDAALSCFCAKGYHGSTVNDIVAASGMSKGNIYWYFPGKEDIFLGVFDRWCQQSLDDMTESLEVKGLSISEVFERVTQKLYNYTNAERSFMVAWLEFAAAASRNEAVRRRLVQISKHFHQKLLKYMRGLIQQNKIKNASAESLALLLGAVYEGLIFKGIIWPEFCAKEKNLRGVMSLFLQLLISDAQELKTIGIANSRRVKQG